MRIAVVSDTHGDTRGIERVLTKVRPAVLVHLGDGEGDAEDTRHIYPDVGVIAVSGNCDMYRRNDLEKMVRLGGKNIFLTHGHRFNVKLSIESLIAYALRLQADIALYGHTHIPYIGFRQGVHIINPGSASLSKNPNPTFALIDIAGDTVTPEIIRII